MGHSVFNWALRYVEASVISGTIFAEPVVSALLAWLILSEKPGVATVVGGAVVLSGLFLLLVRSPASYGTHRMKSCSASQNAAVPSGSPAVQQLILSAFLLLSDRLTAVSQ
jgi:hypothetical protein